MKLYNTITACVLVAVFLLGLFGAPLAKPGTDAQNGETDMLVGVFITRDYIDLFDMDSYIEDNLDELSQGGDFTIDASQSGQRLYASLKDEVITDGDGREITVKQFVFEGVEGYPFVYSRMGEGDEAYSANNTDPAISDTHLSVAYTDDGSSVSLTGTVYFSPKVGEDIVFYFNPVFQAADGRVYLTNGSCNSFGVDMSENEGQLFSTALSDKRSIAENGKTKTDSCELEIKFSLVFEPLLVRIVQMDESSAVLGSAEYSSDELPQSLETEDGAQYIVVETVKRSPDGGETTTRELYSRGDERLYCLSLREDGICVKNSVEISWR